MITLFLMNKPRLAQCDVEPDMEELDCSFEATPNRSDANQYSLDTGQAFSIVAGFETNRALSTAPKPIQSEGSGSCHRKEGVLDSK